MNLPIFPLSIYLLPGGITRLRIFEQRYINMVKNADQTDGFAISFYQEQNEFNISSWASWVDIVDFQLGNDGLLVIDVKCKSLISIINCYRDENNLLQAKVEKKEHWPQSKAILKVPNLTEDLKRLFALNDDLSAMYQGHFQDDLNWVCSRWLELLPVTFADKSLFVEPHSFNSALEFLTTLMVEKNKFENIS